MKKYLILLLSFISVILVSITVITINLAKPVSQVEQEAVRIEIPYGMSVRAVSGLLQEKNVIKNSKLFYLSVKYPFLLKVFYPGIKVDSRFVLKSGIYHIKPNMNFYEIQKMLSSGAQEFIKVSVPEGYTITKIAELLENHRICNKNDFIQASKNSEILNSYNIPAETCEGYLFPDTYFLTLNMDSKKVISLMIENFYSKISQISGLSEKSANEVFEILTLASIVEREYRIANEAPLIASVFRNRLKHNIGLYSCATIEYIITEIQGRPHPEVITIADTKIDNPYNTYMWAGLPPGPISNPGLISLNASANTPKTNYYYFQIVDQNAGRHVFTSTFEEHIENHNIYTKK